MASSDPEEILFSKSKAPVPEGVDVPMCFCGDLSKLMMSEVVGDIYGMRFFMCTNYQHDPPKVFFGGQRPKSPPPLCDFLQWLDTVQTDKDKRYVEETTRNARESWQRMVYEDQQEERRKQEEESREKERTELFRRKEEAEREEAEERERERERKRERIRRAKEAGPEAIRKGKYPRCTQ